MLATSGSNHINVDGGTQGIRIGDIVVGAGIPAGTRVTAIDHDTSTVTLSANNLTAALTATSATVEGTKVTFLSSSHTTGTADLSGSALVYCCRCY